MRINWYGPTLLLCLLGVAGSATAQVSPQVFNVSLSRPGEPIVLDIDLLSARIEVIGEDRDDAMFEVSVRTSSRKIITPSGAKTIVGGSYELEIDEDDNEIDVDADWRAEHVTIVARIPRRADLELETVNEGEIIVRDVTGSLQLSNVNGPITATGISGSVIAESVNEAVDIGFIRLDDDNASSLESINGDLSVRLPANAGAVFYLDTSQGEMTSDFEVEVLPTEPTVEREDGSNSMSLRIENVIKASVNGGGPIVRMKTLHGDIHIGRAN